MRLPLYALGERELKKQKPLLKGTDVRKLQQILKHLGFFQARVDGVFGDETSFSVKKFQRALGKRPNGVVDKNLLDIIENLKKNNAGNWMTYKRDFAHMGFTPLSIGCKLSIKKTLAIPEVTGMVCYADMLIVSSKKGIYCFDTSAGSLRWKNSQISAEVPISFSEYKILVPAGELLIIDAFSGRVEREIGGGDFRTPVAASQGKIYASSLGGTLYTFDLRGNVLWRFCTDGAYCTAPTLAYDLVYFASFDRNIYCLDDKGTLYWKTKIPDLIDDALCIWDSMVFALSKDSFFYCLNPLTGEILWKKKFSDEQFMPPVFNGDSMLVLSDQGKLYALSPQRAAVKWFKELNIVPTTPPIASPKALYFGSENGLIALDLESGEHETCLQGHRINFIAQTRFEIYAATQKGLVLLQAEN